MIYNCYPLRSSYLAVLNNNYLPSKFDAIVAESGCFVSFEDGYAYQANAIRNQTTPILFITGVLGERNFVCICVVC
jgi:hypothetical protein